MQLLKNIRYIYDKNHMMRIIQNDNYQSQSQTKDKFLFTTYIKIMSNREREHKRKSNEMTNTLVQPQ